MSYNPNAIKEAIARSFQFDIDKEKKDEVQIILENKNSYYKLGIEGDNFFISIEIACGKILKVSSTSDSNLKDDFLVFGVDSEDVGNNKIVYIKMNAKRPNDRTMKIKKVYIDYSSSNFELKKETINRTYTNYYILNTVTINPDLYIAGNATIENLDVTTLNLNLTESNVKFNSIKFGNWELKANSNTLNLVYAESNNTEDQEVTDGNQ